MEAVESRGSECLRLERTCLVGGAAGLKCQTATFSGALAGGKGRLAGPQNGKAAFSQSHPARRRSDQHPDQLACQRCGSTHTTCLGICANLHLKVALPFTATHPYQPHPSTWPPARLPLPAPVPRLDHDIALLLLASPACGGIEQICRLHATTPWPVRALT